MTSFNEKLVAYLTLISGISISTVAVYYSVVGLASVFSAAVIPIIIMGVALEASKLVATMWLKLNWKNASVSIRAYLLVAIGVLMLITSIGIFGFLSRAHSDQKLAGAAVTEKLAIYDQKIQAARDRIDTNRKSLGQLDTSVDQIMVRSTTERGANKAVLLRKTQAKERDQLISNIETEQQRINDLIEESLPLRNKLRDVESEVGPIKYIAEFVYGDTDVKLLERAVTWMIITLILVFDPLAVVLLLAAQISFQIMRERNSGEQPAPAQSANLPTATNLQINDDPKTSKEVPILEQHPYLGSPFSHFTNLKPLVEKQQFESEQNVQNQDQQERSAVPTASTASNITQQQYLKAAQEYLRTR